jgi:hypothetical protein
MLSIFPLRCQAVPLRGSRVIAATAGEVPRRIVRPERDVIPDVMEVQELVLDRSVVNLKSAEPDA